MFKFVSPVCWQNSHTSARSLFGNVPRIDYVPKVAPPQHLLPASITKPPSSIRRRTQITFLFAGLVEQAQPTWCQGATWKHTTIVLRSIRIRLPPCHKTTIQQSFVLGRQIQYISNLCTKEVEGFVYRRLSKCLDGSCMFTFQDGLDYSRPRQN